MSEISNVNASNFGYYVKNQPSFGRQEAACPHCEEEYDSFEHSNENSTVKEVTKGAAVIVPLTAATLWLTKGKGWAKIVKLFSKPNNNPIGESFKKAYVRPTTKVEQNPKLKEVDIVNNIETVNTNNKSRKLVEQARRDNPTKEQLEEYAKEVAYVAPTKEKKQVINHINAEANRETAIAHQVQNNIPQEQVDALRKAAQETGSVVKKTGTFKTKDGITVTLKDSNITEIILADGRKITKLATICKYQNNIDLTSLEKI